MIALLLAAFVVGVLLVCLWMGLAILAGIMGGIIDMVVWCWRKHRGRQQGPAPWEKPSPTAANAAPVPFEVRTAVWARDGGQCVYCGASEDLAVDHVVPRAHGGSNDPENLALACRHCSSSKGTGPAPGVSHVRVLRVIERTFEDARRAKNGHG